MINFAYAHNQWVPLMQYLILAANSIQIAGMGLYTLAKLIMNWGFILTVVGFAFHKLMEFAGQS
jgi:hypothetical protein